MKQVFFNYQGNVVVEDIPAPVCEPGKILVRTYFSLISSGTELQSLKGKQVKLDPVSEMKTKIKSRILQGKALAKKIIKEGYQSTRCFINDKLAGKLDPLSYTGYSAAGKVIAIGVGITDIKIGDRVACAGAGIANHAEVINVPRNLTVKIPKGVSYKDACFGTLGAISMQGVRRAKVQLGDYVAVVGLGLIGQLICQIASAAGTRVIAIDLKQTKVDLAKKLGAYKSYLATDKNLTEKILTDTQGHGVDSTIIAASTKSSDPANQAFEMTRERGRVVVVGAIGMDLERAVFYKKEQDFLISRSYGPGRYDMQYEEKGIDYPFGYVRWTENRNIEEFLKLISEQKVNIRRLITAEFELRDAKKAYAGIGQNPDTLAVILRYDVKKDEKKLLARKVILLSKPIDKNKIQVGIIGPGKFASAVHIPNIIENKEAAVKSVAALSNMEARDTATKFKIKEYTTDYKDILNDRDIDLVMVTTRHNLHAPIIKEALQRNKNVFVEKPMTIKVDDAKEIVDLSEKKKRFVSVGFNRRFSPLSQELHKRIKGKYGPFVATFRINGAVTNIGHWTSDPAIGGGRIIGEGVHFLDYLCWMIDSEPIRVYAEKIKAGRPEVIDNDNVVATIYFENGSIGTMIYSAIGNPGFPKEQFEIFGDNSMAQINDFKTLKMAGFGKKKIALDEQNKGHREELQNVIKALKGKERLEINARDGMRATVIADAVLKSLSEKKPQEIIL